MQKLSIQANIACIVDISKKEYFGWPESERWLGCIKLIVAVVKSDWINLVKIKGNTFFDSPVTISDFACELSVIRILADCLLNIF